VHIAQHTLSSDLARLEEDVTALLSALENAWQNGQAPGEAVSVLRNRILAAPDAIEESIGELEGSALDFDVIASNLSHLESAIGAVGSLANEAQKQQSEYAASVDLLRNSGAAAARALRSASLGRMADNLSRLTSATLEYAPASATGSAADTSRLLAALNRDRRIDRGVPAATGDMIDAAAFVLGSKETIRSRLDQLEATPIAGVASNLDRAVTDSYQAAVASTDRARIFLAIYGVVMLLCVGAIGYRLHGSYREINRANAELELLNESLEQRVHSRTEDLETALSDLKESQVQLVQAEKMSSLGQLVAGISHEINTPLLYLANNASMILERVELLREFVEQSVSALSVSRSAHDDRKQYQAKLVENLRMLKQLLRDNELEASVEEISDLTRDSIEGLSDLTEMAQSLKDFSRLDRAPVGSYDVNAGVDKTLTIARNIVKAKADVRKDFGDLPTIECSPSQINQVFLNLITNAAQSIEGHGEIVIATARRDSDHVVISIADNGCGIPAENLGKIRDPFFTTKEVGNGTGLGLSIVDEIVRGHNGELVVESKVGAGSTFSVILPIRQPKAMAQQDASSADGPNVIDIDDLAEAV
jgi:two-component system NtrC family sensor kinase